MNNTGSGNGVNTPNGSNAQRNPLLQNDKCQKCSSPAEIFSIATALTLLFSRELDEKQLNTLINLLGLLQAGLGAVVTQMQICAGDEVQPPTL